MSGLTRWKENALAQLRQSPLAQRWQHLPSRERVALTALAAFLLLVLLYMSIWQPIVQRMERARSYYDSQRVLYTYLQENAPKARSVAGAKAVLAPEQLQGLVTTSAQQRGLNLERLDNDGSSGLLISLAKAPFEPLLLWLSELQSQGVRLSEVNFDRSDTGKVDAKVTLQAGQ
jgi:general secretion pathway protein M